MLVGTVLDARYKSAVGVPELIFTDAVPTWAGDCRVYLPFELLQDGDVGGVRNCRDLERHLLNTGLKVVGAANDGAVDGVAGGVGLCCRVTRVRIDAAGAAARS